MIVMVSNATGFDAGLLAGLYPGRVGHLFSPGGQRGPWAEVPFALDNGAWPAFLHNEDWDEDLWHALLRWAALAGPAPLWALVRDVVGDREATIENWHRHLGAVTRYGFRPAFALQDGMTFDDVPTDDCMLFVGGGRRVEGCRDRAVVRSLPGPRARRARQRHAPAPGRVPRRRRVGGWHRLVS